MGILNTLLSALGLDSSSGDEHARETTVSVEREANTETEAVVKGTDEGSESAGAAGTDATASTGSLVDSNPDGEAAEPAEAVDTDETETELDTVEAESEGESTGEHEATDEAEPTPSDEPVDIIKGIGPAYADRLANAGVHSVSDLAAADAADLADAIDLSETRVGRWIDRANEHGD
ncbi:helix-hairpin-helix domain-containing protein [Haloplanus sp. C73]|uniref:helix-hairpin-helix domain-containing protein n=1 Tax=Haloplanus sp. C73 TaxID=3421641 RepID=UPI003EB9E618